jgi:hypothetical protein
MAHMLFFVIIAIFVSCDHCDQVFVVPEDEVVCVDDADFSDWARNTCGPPDVGPLFCEPEWVCQFPKWDSLQGGSNDCNFCVETERMKTWVDANCKGMCRVEKQVDRNGVLTGGGVILRCR